MLNQLLIKNFALVEDLTVDFSNNFNIMTGETGAGKSIIIDALTLLLGGRAQSEFIRTGTKKAIIEGVFYLPDDHYIGEFLRELEIESEDSLLVLSREVSLNGRNICRINGRVFTLGQYQQVGLAIVDIHGQHDHQILLQGDKHLYLLDKSGGQEHQLLRQEVKEKFEKYLYIYKELQELRATEKERLQKIDYLSFQRDEIKQAQIRSGEFEELSQEVKLLAHAGKINENLHCAYEQLFGGENGISAYDLLSKALNNLQELQDFAPFLQEIFTQLEPALYIIEESASQIRGFKDDLDYSPARLEECENRLYSLKNLCKKYGPTTEDVLLYTQKIETELEKWLSSSERLAELENKATQAYEEYRTTAIALSVQREKTAATIQKKVVAELVELAMANVQFEVKFFPCEPSRHGLEQAEFYISPNPGEPLLPVAKIASGGELSRIILALKIIMAEIDEIGTLVFDEIDAGIGGKTAQKVAEKLERISRCQQVICVTHSPLIAAIADRHLLLEKVLKEGRTYTIIHQLSQAERIEELARMLGGDNPSEELKKHAGKILKK